MTNALDRVVSMKLSFKNVFLSISRFDDVVLPNFAILTGRNGSGKTQLLKAIERGDCVLEGIPSHEIKYFSHLEFKLGDQKSIPQAQASQRFSQILDAFDGKAGNPKANFRSIALQIWNSEIKPHLANDGALFGLDLRNHRLFDETQNEQAERVLEKYRSRVSAEVFSPLAQVLDGQSLCVAGKSTVGPIHDIQSNTHLAAFIPETSNRGILNTSLGSLFSRYKIDQYNWARNQSEVQDSEKKFSELLIEFESRNRKPWDVVNEVFERMNKYSTDDNVFSFSVTNPENTKINFQNVDTFSFSPQVSDRKSGQVFGFESLSSGEMVLAALCVAILEMESTVGRPKVLLLDEVEASLHPSMISAFLDTLRTSFVNRGTAIILATHSPSTVSLAEPETLFLVAPKSARQKIQRADRNEAISILTEGLATISDAKIIFNGLQQPVNILTEGFNTVHLKKFIELSGLDGVGVVEGLEKRSGKSQLQTHAELLASVGPEQTLLFVFDSDAKAQFDKIKETDKIKKFIFEKRHDGFPCTGIENMYERALLEPFLHTKTVTELGETREYKTLEDYCKRDFENYLAVNATTDDFQHFNALKTKIVEVLATQQL